MRLSFGITSRALGCPSPLTIFTGNNGFIHFSLTTVQKPNISARGCVLNFPSSNFYLHHLSSGNMSGAAALCKSALMSCPSSFDTISQSQNPTPALISTNELDHILEQHTAVQSKTNLSTVHAIEPAVWNGLSVLICLVCLAP